MSVGVICCVIIMTSWNGDIFSVTDPLWGESNGHRWIPLTKASDAEIWCFLWSPPEKNGWANNRDAGDLRRHRAHYDIIVVIKQPLHRSCVLKGLMVGWHTRYIPENIRTVVLLSYHFMMTLYIIYIYIYTYIYTYIAFRDTLRVLGCPNTLQWRHCELDGVSNHRRLDCLFNRSFRHRSKEASKFRVTGLCWGNPSVAGRFPSDGQ